MTQSITRPPETFQWTLDAYRTAWEAGTFGDVELELIDGELFLVGSASPEHQWLIDLLRKYLEPKLVGKAILIREEKTVFINENTTPEPDISVVKDKNYFKTYPRPEDVYLAVEIANTHSETATRKKKKTYAQSGIPQYWVYDIKREILRVYDNPSNGEYCERLLQDGTLKLLGEDIPIADLLRLMREGET